MFPSFNTFTPEQKKLLTEYMEEICKDCTFEESYAILRISLALGSTGLPLNSPHTLKALEIVTNYITFMQGLKK